MHKLEQRFHQLQRIVLALSGVHKDVLALVPSERPRFESLGWAILITSSVAAVSMWFALSSAVGINGILALPVALAWGLAIMGIDRWLIVSMGTQSTRKIAVAVPRLILALLLGTLISTPLVLRVFQSEINAQIAKMQQQNYSTYLQQQRASDVAKQVSTYSGELKYLNNVIATHGAATASTASDPELTAYNKQLTSLNTELTRWTSLENKYYGEYICQLYGGSSCPKKGDGPAAKDSHKNYQGAVQEVSNLKGQINHVHAEIQQRDTQLSSNSKADQQARYQQALTQQPIVKNEYNTALQRQNELQANFFATNQAAHGILIRLEALSQLSNGNPTVTTARFLLFLLFLVIECLPVTVKLLQRPGLYEEALQQAREAERKDVRRFFSFRPLLTGPQGTMLLQADPEAEVRQRVNAIWSPVHALPGSVITDDQPPGPADDPGAGWAQAGYAEPGGEAPAPPWHGADRWRNHWLGQPAADPDQPTVTAPPMAPDGPGGTPVGLEEKTPPAGDSWPAGDRTEEGPYSDWARRDQATQAESGSLVTSGGWAAEPAARYQDQASSDGFGGSGQLPGTASPGGGTPLSWDEDE